jgi:hypothetical protein
VEAKLEALRKKFEERKRMEREAIEKVRECVCV